MSDPASVTNVPSLDTSNLACIDGQNTESVSPLREFLRAYGLTIETNAIPDTECLYQIVVGTSKQVKDIFSRANRIATRRLILLQDDTTQEAHILSVLFNAKVAVIGNRSIEQDEPRVVFGFLCEEGSTVIDLRREISKQSLPVVHKKIPPKKELSQLVEKGKPATKNAVDYWEKDEKRIAKTIHDIYTPTVKKSGHPDTAKKAARFLLFLLGLFFVSHVLSVFLSIMFLFISLRVTNNSSLLPTTLSTAKVFHLYAKTSFQPIAVLLPVTPIRTYERLLSVIEQSEILYGEVVSFKTTLDPALIFSSTTTPTDKTVFAELLSLRKKGETIKLKLSLIQAELGLLNTALPDSFSFLKSRLSGLEEKGRRAGETMETLIKLSTLYPLLAPPEERRVYLLLFQNSTELRPTGGFIGSVGKVITNNGKIEDITIEDVYTYDGQLRGHVDPPLPIRTILQQEHWYLRDSNWDPDFEVSGERASWFYEKSGGEQVHGVIAITLPFLHDVLDATGPIQITESPEIITKDTLFPLIHNQVEENFFPGSTQKKDLLGSIFRTLLTEITQSKADPIKLSTAITRGLQSRNIQVYSREPGLGQLLRAYNWSGSFQLPDGCGSTCTVDFLSMVEANLGVNKANAEVRRRLEKQLTFSGSSIRSTDTIRVENTSDANDTGGGEYTSYTRVYYPSSTKIVSVQVNGEFVEFSTPSLTPKPRPYTELLTEKEGFTTIGIAYDVPSHTTAVITIEQEQVVSDQKQYMFLFRHQAGTGTVPLTIRGTTPPEITPTRLFADQGNTPKSEFIAVSGNFEYTMETDQDNSLVISFH